MFFKKQWTYICTLCWWYKYHCNVTFSPPFSYLRFGKKFLNVAQTKGIRIYASTHSGWSVYINYSSFFFFFFLMGNFVHILHLFSHLFISAWTSGFFILPYKVWEKKDKEEDWLWWDPFFIDCWILFDNISLRIFVSILVRENGLSFSFL